MAEKPPHYRHDPDVQLATLIEEYEEARQEYWRGRIDGADWDLQEGMYAHARQVAEVLSRRVDR